MLEDRRSASIRRLPMGAVAATGVFVGHWLTYLLAVPQANLRDTVLAESGHAYWFVAVRLVATVGVAGVGAFLFRRFTAATRGDKPGAVDLLSVATWLAATQVVGFTMMELLERVASGAPLSSLLLHHVFLLGLLVQIGLAGLLASILSWLGRVASSATSLATRPRVPRPSLAVRVSPARSRMIVGPWRPTGGIRAPPARRAVVGARLSSG